MSDRNTVSQFDYEKSIWGEGRASTRISAPTSFRLRQSLRAITSLPAGAKVMELGCGAGQFIREIKIIRPDLICYGADISESAITLAKQTGDGVIYEVSAEKKLPYDDNFFDAVLIFDVLEHVEDPGAIMAEVRRTLKTGGIFYGFVPCEGDMFSLWRWLRTCKIGAQLTRVYAGHINYFSRAQLRALIESYGFDIVRMVHSEHVIGQLLGVAAFASMDRFAKKHAVNQVNNEQYFHELHKKGGRVLSVLKNIINSIVFIESTLLASMPSPNAHITAIKK